MAKETNANFLTYKRIRWIIHLISTLLKYLQSNHGSLGDKPVSVKVHPSKICCSDITLTKLHSKMSRTQLKLRFYLISFPGVNVLVPLYKKVDNSIYCIYFLTFLLFIFQTDAPKWKVYVESMIASCLKQGIYMHPYKAIWAKFLLIYTRWYGTRNFYEAKAFSEYMQCIQLLALKKQVTLRKVFYLHWKLTI